MCGDGSQILGSIGMFGGTFAVKDYAFCWGQIDSIAENQALFSLLGTYYGGDGRTTYGIPDLRGRTPVGYGAGPGLTDWNFGTKYGFEKHILTIAQMPEHNHAAVFTPNGGGGSPITATVSVNAKNGKGDSNNAQGNYWATGDVAISRDTYSVEGAYSSSSDTTMAADAVEVYISGGQIGGGTVVVGDTGLSQSFSLMQPFSVINYEIAMQGLYPSRN